MKFELSTIVKCGFYTAVFLLSTDLLHLWYVRQRKRILQQPINEVAFVMSNALPCCPHSAPITTVNKCRNPHCKAKLSLKIIEHIDSAQHLICAAMYMLTMRPIADALLRAHKRGVTVRIISDNSMIATSGSQVNRLQLERIAVRIAGDGEKYMHNKFCLIDVLVDESGFKENKHPVNGVLINGSMNWTANGFDRNWENIHFTSDEHLKSEYKKAFDYIWCRLA